MTIKADQPQPNRNGSWMIGLFYGLIAFTLVEFVVNALGSGTEPLTYSAFEHLLDTGKIKDVTVQGNTLSGDFTAPVDGQTSFITTRVPSDLASDLAKHHIDYGAIPEESFAKSLFSMLLPPLLFVGVWILASRSMGGGGFGRGMLSIGKSPAKIFAETNVKITFADVAGVDEAKVELHEIVDFLKHPENFGRLGAHVPRGILLVGPPGTGKTLLARAVAGEAGVPFYSTNGSEFVEMFVGVGAARVRDLFEQARKSAPCIIFIDELDALGRSRSLSPLSGHDEKEQTLNQLLADMDGFDRSAAVVILAATNRPEILDPALLRAGRFDRQVLVDRPDKIGRRQILAIHLKNLVLAPDINPDELAAMTPGFTGADLANLANEAAVVATRRGGVAVTEADFVAGIERIVAGLEKRSRILVPKERRAVACHEMGHALVALALQGTDQVRKVSIIPHGIGALGYTLQAPTDDRFLMSRQELVDKMTVLVAGRAAEALVLDDISTGAADDLGKATDIARSMVIRFGMDQDIGIVAYDASPGSFLNTQTGLASSRLFSEATQREIDQAVKKLLDTALERATAILRANRPQLDKGTEALLSRETLTADEIPRPLMAAAE